MNIFHDKYLLTENIIEYGDDKNLVLVSNLIDNNTVLVLNTTSIVIYQSIKDGNNINDIILELSTSFPDTPTEQIEEDVLEIINTLIEYRIIKTNEYL